MLSGGIVGRAHRLARTVETDDDDGKLVLPVRYGMRTLLRRAGKDVSVLQT